MSFILEALKKSEQQRQDLNAPQQQVRKRTLSLQSRRTERRLMTWLVAGLVPLGLLGGWWLYSQTYPVLERPPEQPLASDSPAATSPPKQPALVVITPAPVPLPLRPVAAAEPAPVPSAYVAAPAVRVKTPPAEGPGPALETQPTGLVSTGVMKADEQVATVVVAPTQSQALDSMPLESGAGQMPSYGDLSGALRDRMPPLAMSMHFYNKDPVRRLVRINDRLLREGDWVGRDVELVEITPTGVILDFLGKSFELLSSNR